MEGFLRNDSHNYVASNYARVFIWPAPDDPRKVLGYYTLSSNIVQKSDLNNKYDRKAVKGLPVPVALIGYMGRCEIAPKGLGAALILDAARRVSRANDIGVWGLALDAENEGLAKWYSTLGFTAAKSKPLFMYGPLKIFLA